LYSTVVVDDVGFGYRDGLRYTSVTYNGARSSRTVFTNTAPKAVSVCKPDIVNGVGRFQGWYSCRLAVDPGL
jgi:hypothetical protein